MKRSRFTEHQILAVLKEADAGATVKDLCRRHGISPATYYQWKSKYAGLQASDLKKIRELERENARLKQLYAETSLENQALKELIHRKL
ncbi:MAG: transposase [Actinobacteria bacterium RBG_16_64_13]|nr:MAG: transposase [Actinobacteria bacterium RBG_16_64_13]